MAFLGYTVKIPEAALGHHAPPLKEIEWVTRLGKYCDDINLRGITMHKIAKGWRYEAVDIKGKEMLVKIFSEKRVNGTPIFQYRPPIEGDYYVKHTDGTWSVMHEGYLRWYRRKLHERLIEQLQNDPEVMELARDLGVEIK